MTERRYDPTTGEWVTFATHRQNRTFKPPADLCPLCPGSAARGGEIDRDDFDVVVFDNRFPSLQVGPPEPDVAGTDLLPVRPAAGRCEVVVYSADHSTTLAEVGQDRVRLLVDVWADRYEVLGAEGHAYVLPFENKGEAVGVTLHHPHGQIYAFADDVPPRPLRELTRAAEHRGRTGRCLFCDVADGELASGERVVVEGEHFVAHVPFWARFPYEVRITARRHLPSLPAATPDQRDDLARVLVGALQGLDALFGFSMPYIMGLFGAPTGGDPASAGWDGGWDELGHFTIMISPPYRSATRLKYLAGVELMGGAFMTDVAPEAAAAQLREAARGARRS